MILSRKTSLVPPNCYEQFRSNQTTIGYPNAMIKLYDETKTKLKLKLNYVNLLLIGEETNFAANFSQELL